MKRSLAHIALSIVINALRFTLALVFTFSGFVKAADPMGLVYKMTDYADAFGIVIPFGLLLVGAILLIVWEYMMGVCLFFGLYRRLYLSLMIVFLVLMTPLALYSAVYNPVADCGCFGAVITA